MMRTAAKMFARLTGKAKRAQCSMLDFGRALEEIRSQELRDREAEIDRLGAEVSRLGAQNQRLSEALPGECVFSVPDQDDRERLHLVSGSRAAIDSLEFMLRERFADGVALGKARNGKKMSLRIVRADGFGGFGAYLAGTLGHGGASIELGANQGLVLLDVEALFDDSCLETEDGSAVERTAEEKQRLLIQVLMHEFGHALEEFFDAKFDEDWIEKVTESFASRKEVEG